MNDPGRPRILDGARLAARRADGLARRAADVSRRRGRPPVLGIVAPAAARRHVELKRRAAAAIGVDIRAIEIAAHATTVGVSAQVRRLAHDGTVDGIFVQYPLPAGVAEDAVFAEIPAGRDVDVLSHASFAAFLAGPGPAPATAEAALLLLDAHAVALHRRTVRAVGAPSSLQQAFEVLCARRGATVQERVDATHPDLDAVLADTDVVIALVAQPRAIPASAVRAGAIAIDGGYFNPGGRGDFDTAPGLAHLGALVPVPGGLGPVTVSVLLERTIARAGG